MSVKNKIVPVLTIAGFTLLTVAGIALSEGSQAEAPAVVGKYGPTEVISMQPVPLLFSHKFHVREAGLDCDSCHPDVFKKKMGAASENGDFTMAAFEEGKYCGTCHNGDDAFGVVDKADCSRCHNDPPTEVVFNRPVKGVKFGHAAHVDMGLECSDCHSKVFKMSRGWAERRPDEFTMAAFAEGKYCGACHNGDAAFDANASDQCVTCHQPPEEVVFKEPVKAVIFSHQGHVDSGLECGDCHNEVFAMELGKAESAPEDFVMDALYEGRYCGACHNGEDAFASDTRCTLCHIGVKGYEKLFGKPGGGGGHGGH